MAYLTVHGGLPGKYNWPEVEYIDYTRLQFGKPALARHPFDDGVWLGGATALDEIPKDVDAVVSLCLTGTAQVPLTLEHLTFRLMDRPEPDQNPNLDYQLVDAANAVTALRDEGKKVQLHCIAAHSRTPTVGIVYAMLRGHSLAEATASVCGALPAASPNSGFQAAMKRLETRLVDGA